MAKIRHLAIKADNPEKLAKFYVEVFGLEILLHDDDREVIYLSDGDLCLALLPTRGKVKPGLAHFGFHIDDFEKISGKLEKAGVGKPQARPNNPPYAETRAVDPEGNTFDLSVHGFTQAVYDEDRAAQSTSKNPDPKNVSKSRSKERV